MDFELRISNFGLRLAELEEVGDSTLNIRNAINFIETRTLGGILGGFAQFGVC